MIAKAETVQEPIHPPYVWFGGKRKVAPLVWDALGDADSYVEPFFGGGSVWLMRPPEHERRLETVNDYDGLVCLAPETRVLRSNLIWSAIGDVRLGDSLLGFDEHNGPARIGCVAPESYRKWANATVTGMRTAVKPCYRLIFDDGTTVVASSDHLWLGGSHKTGGHGWRWQKTESLVANRNAQKSWVMKAVDVVLPETTFDSGWVAGFYDGEGNLRLSNGVSGWTINITQKLGPELDRLKNILSTRGFRFHESVRAARSAKHSQMSYLTISGGMRETLRFAMTFRPQRLLASISKSISYTSFYGRDRHSVGIISKEYLGEKEVVSLETSTRTFVAEGLSSHNCNFWRAVQREPEAVAHGLNWPVNEVDLEARHRALCRMPDKAAFLERMKREPDYYDVERAAWWCWGLNAWIGGGWCGGEYWPGEAGQSKGCGVCDGANKLPHLGRWRGIHRQLPHLGDAGMGIHRKRPHLGGAGMGEYERRYAVLRDWMCAIRDRLRNVRVCCGDWERVCTYGATAHGRIVGIFLDPPYSAEANRDAALYRCEDLSVAHRVREYCIERGANPRYRLVLCGYDGEHDELERHGWRVQAWKASGGFASHAKGDTQGKANAHRERIWFSPHCLRASEPAPPPQLALEAAT